MLEKSNLFQSSEKAILVGVALKEQKDHQVNEYLQELAFLATTAGAVTAKIRAALLDIQTGVAKDEHNWTVSVG